MTWKYRISNFFLFFWLLTQQLRFVRSSKKLGSVLQKENAQISAISSKPHFRELKNQHVLSIFQFEISWKWLFWYFSITSYVQCFYLWIFLLNTQKQMAHSAKLVIALLHIFAWSFLGILEMSNGTETDIYCLRSIKESLEDPYNYLKYSWNFSNNREGFICEFVGVEC